MLEGAVSPYIPYTVLLIVIFGILYWRDRKAGGYKVEKIREHQET